MNRADRSDERVQDLISRYVDLGLQQDEAAYVLDTAQYNRLTQSVSQIARKLKLSRAGREALLLLLDHPNMQIQFNAATHLMASDPQRARKRIEMIASSNLAPTAGIAGTYLIMLDT